MIVISDNSPLSAFLAINRLDILKSMYEKIIIPKAVYQELENLKLRGVDISPIQNAERIEIQMAIPMPNVLPSGVLDAGETEAIWLAKQLNADWLIIDENKGRKVALQLGLSIVGVLGILVKAKQDGYLESLKNTIDNLQTHSNFRLHPDLIANVLRLVGEII